MNRVFGKDIRFTEGKIVTLLIRFAVPLLLTELLQNLYQSVDAWVVGNYVSTEALAAVNVSSTLSMLVTGFFTGMSIGVSVVVSRVFGVGDRENLCRSMSATFSFSTLLGVFLSLLGILLTPFLVDLVQSAPEVRQAAISYLRVYLAGLMFTVIYNTGAGILRAIGNTRWPFYILCISCILNILLDLLLVAVLSMGVQGAGLATLLSQAVSVFIVYGRIRRYDKGFALNPKAIGQDGRSVWDMFRIGMPAGLQGALISFSNLFVWRYTATFGTSAMAGVGIAQKLDRFINLPGKAFGSALTVFVSQNLGAGQKERANKGTLHCFILSFLVLAVIGSLMYVIGPQCVSLFDKAPDTIAVGTAMMRIIIPLYGFFTLREIVLGVLRGHGDSLLPTFLSLTGMVLIRQLFLRTVMSTGHDILNIYLCYPIGWGSAAILVTLYFLIRYRLVPFIKSRKVWP